MNTFSDLRKVVAKEFCCSCCFLSPSPCSLAGFAALQMYVAHAQKSQTFFPREVNSSASMAWNLELCNVLTNAPASNLTLLRATPDP